jgi:mono/diheme cytochrome c family protein/plastocyanin
MKTSRILFWGLACLTVIGTAVTLIIARLPLTIHVSTAENGGFSPDYIRATVGQPLHLHLVSEDVEHTFALGQSQMEPVTLKPGQPVDFTLNFDRPGKYTFYTTNPSTINFWRIRGTIEVTGSEPLPTSQPPLYVRLGLNLDAEHEADGMGDSMYWNNQPSARRGAAFKDLISPSYLLGDYYFSHSPLETYNKLRDTPELKLLKNDDIWDLSAYIWQQETSPVSLVNGKQIYDVNCAVCHGNSGAGDGQFANDMKVIANKQKDAHGIQAPTDFTKPEHLINSNPALVQGKILRGGMGTGMPMWGDILTNEQTWNVVAYLYSFQFDYSK